MNNIITTIIGTLAALYLAWLIRGWRDSAVGRWSTGNASPEARIALVKRIGTKAFVRRKWAMRYVLRAK